MNTTVQYNKLMSYMNAAAAGISFIGVINATTKENAVLSLLNMLFMFLNIYFAKINSDIYETKVCMAIAEYIYDHKDEIEEAIKEKREHDKDGASTTKDAD